MRSRLLLKVLLMCLTHLSFSVLYSVWYLAKPVGYVCQRAEILNCCNEVAMLFYQQKGSSGVKSWLLMPVAAVFPESCLESLACTWGLRCPCWEAFRFSVGLSGRWHQSPLICSHWVLPRLCVDIYHQLFSLFSTIVTSLRATFFLFCIFISLGLTIAFNVRKGVNKYLMCKEMSIESRNKTAGSETLIGYASIKWMFPQNPSLHWCHHRDGRQEETWPCSSLSTIVRDRSYACGLV